MAGTRVWDALTESQAFGQGRPGFLPTAKVKLPRSFHSYNYGKMEYEKCEKLCTKLELTCTEVSLQRSFSFAIMEYY